MPPLPRPRRRRGAVLLVAIGVLAVLTVFALSLASLMRLERRAATNVTDAARARFCAEAGIERATFRLTETELGDPVSSFHAPWTYRSQDGRAWGHGLPLAAAKNPSFKSGVTAEGLAYSAVVGGSYRPDGDQVVLEVWDAASRLSLNGRQPGLASMLDALGRAIAHYDARRVDPADGLMYDAGLVAWKDARRRELIERGMAPGDAADAVAPRDPVAGRGASIVALRTTLGGRFTRTDQLAPAIGAEDARLLGSYVTCDAWLDPVTVGVDPVSGKLVPQPRAPVNVNTASWPVLVACLEGVSAARVVHPAETCVPIGPATARGLASAIEARRRGVRQGAVYRAPGGEPFRGWADLRVFLGQDLDGDGRNDHGLDLTQQAALIANADPNLLEARRNPDGAVHPGLGKLDLAASTTELSVISFGVYEVGALGRVLGGDGTVAAECELRSAIVVYDTLRLTTQADFESVRASDEVEKTSSFPNPVRAATGAFRVHRDLAADDGDEVVFEPIADPAARRALRVQAGSRVSGHVQLIADEPLQPKSAEVFAGTGAGSTAIGHRMHLFRFGSDLRGELWRFWNPQEAGFPGNAPDFWVEDPTHPDGGYYTLLSQRICTAGEHPLWDKPRREGLQPTLADRVASFAVACGAAPEALGLDPYGDPAVNPDVPDDLARWQALQALAASRWPAGRPVYDEDLGPDGLLVRPEREGDLRYRVSYQNARGSDVLDNRSGVFLWFKLNQSEREAWTPILDAWHEVGGHPYVGAGPGANAPATFRFQVEARLVHQPAGPGYWLEVRSRRWSLTADGRLAPLSIWDPVSPPVEQAQVDADNPEAVDYNAAGYSRLVRLELDEARASEWHYLYVPYYGNVHFPFVDAVAGELRSTVATDDAAVLAAGWPLPDWPDELKDRIAPGGFVWPAAPARPPFAEVTLDEMLTTSFQLNVRPPRAGGGPYRRDRVGNLYGTAQPTQRLTRRFEPWGPDHVGSFRAKLPPFDADHVKVGRLVWTELLPGQWGLKRYESGDFQSQSTWRHSKRPRQRGMSRRALPRPAGPLMSDEYVRFWRLRYLDERAAFVGDLEAHYARLLARAPAEATATFTAYRDTFAGERAALEQERTDILSAWGPPTPPPGDGGTSLAFGAETVLSPDDRQLELQVDFMYFDRAQSRATPPPGRDGQVWWSATTLNVSPVLDDVVVPYQDRARVLWMDER